MTARIRRWLNGRRGESAIFMEQADVHELKRLRAIPALLRNYTFRKEAKNDSLSLGFVPRILTSGVFR